MEKNLLKMTHVLEDLHQAKHLRMWNVHGLPSTKVGNGRGLRCHFSMNNILSLLYPFQYMPLCFIIHGWVLSGQTWYFGGFCTGPYHKMTFLSQTTEFPRMRQNGGQRTASTVSRAVAVSPTSETRGHISGPDRQLQIEGESWCLGSTLGESHRMTGAAVESHSAVSALPECGVTLRLRG